jgi:hypothetical protein
MLLEDRVSLITEEAVEISSRDVVLIFQSLTDPEREQQ